MPLPSLPPLPNPTDVRTDAIAALIDRLGIAKASIFLGEIFWQPTDYLKIKEELFATETVETLYNKILDWRDNTSHPDI